MNTTLSESQKTRLIHGYQAQQGACNPSGLLHAIEQDIQSCIEEGVSVREDVGISMMVHQLRFLMNFQSEPAPLDSDLTNEELLEAANSALRRCSALREQEANFSTDMLYNDPELHVFVYKLYKQTKAWSYDDGLLVWSKDYDLCKTAYEPR